jgi:hypothetical protein
MKADEPESMAVVLVKTAPTSFIVIGGGTGAYGRSDANGLVKALREGAPGRLRATLIHCGGKVTTLLAGQRRPDDSEGKPLTPDARE